MQQDADFITADFLYMFRASCAHHQEYKILTRQPPVQVVMRKSAVIKSASCCITSVFYLTLYGGERIQPATITTCTGGCRVSILYSWWWALDARNMYRKSTVIKSASCCITSVFYLTEIVFSFQNNQQWTPHCSQDHTRTVREDPEESSYCSVLSFNPGAR